MSRHYLAFEEYKAIEFTRNEPEAWAWVNQEASMVYVSCRRCCGNKTLEAYRHVEGGKCFRCLGSGRELAEVPLTEEMRARRFRAYWTMYAQEPFHDNFDFLALCAASEGPDTSSRAVAEAWFAAGGR